MQGRRRRSGNLGCRRRQAAGETRATGGSALARLVARLLLVDDVEAPLAPHDKAVPLTRLRRLDRMPDLHDAGPKKRVIAPGPPVARPRTIRGRGRRVNGLGLPAQGRCICIFSRRWRMFNLARRPTGRGSAEPVNGRWGSQMRSLCPLSDPRACARMPPTVARPAAMLASRGAM